MITKKILDFDYQLNRIFGKFISQKEYDRPDIAEGIYDIIVCHREGFQDNFNNILKYANYNTKIVVDVTTESGNLQMFLDDFFEKVSNHSNQFYLIIDSNIDYYIYHHEFYYKNLKILQGFDLVFYAFLNKSSDNRLDNANEIFANTNGFISLNNSCRLHRVYLLLQLLKRNISIENCSFLFSTGGHGGSKFNKGVFEDCIEHLLISNSINNSDASLLKSIDLPKNLDYDLNQYSYINNQINELYRPIINLVTENVIGMTHGDASEYDLITFTEKIIKPFLAKQIPLFIALPGLQQTLRDLGFDLFDDLIQTNYEFETNHENRIKMILDELERLLKLDLVEYKKQNEFRFENNYKLLETLTNSGEERMKSFLYEEILK